MPFAHEKLVVYQRSIDFVAWTEPLLESIPTSISARDQLDRASTSVPLNIAEGNGKLSPNGRARYFQMAHGSALECAAALDVLVARKCRFDGAKSVRVPEEAEHEEGEGEIPP
ncbi:MAG: four helix bundle protein [Chthoniobacteraceae bacterium]